ncbi:MAG: hypothetical protein M1449_06010 [Candidatus Thermoplasmatota archaeon]|nr:hypothetical protein [Candidatus Thermoplasmatota archaeon]
MNKRVASPFFFLSPFFQFAGLIASAAGMGAGSLLAAQAKRLMSENFTSGREYQTKDRQQNT